MKAIEQPLVTFPVLWNCGKYLPFLLAWIQFTEITQLEFFVVEDHLRGGILFLIDVDQVLTTDKGLSMQKAWHDVCRFTSPFHER